MEPLNRNVDGEHKGKSQVKNKNKKTTTQHRSSENYINQENQTTVTPEKHNRVKKRNLNKLMKTMMGMPQNRLNSLERHRERVGGRGGVRRRKRRGGTFGEEGLRSQLSHQHSQEATSPKRRNTERLQRGIQHWNTQPMRRGAGTEHGDAVEEVWGRGTTKHLTALTSSVPETVQILRGRQKQVCDWLQVYRAVLWYAFPRHGAGAGVRAAARLRFHQFERRTIHELDVAEAKTNKWKQEIFLLALRTYLQRRFIF